MAISIHIEPTAAPIGVQGYSLNSTAIFLSWSPPPVKHRNGIIHHYQINWTNAISDNAETITTMATHFLFQNLEPNSTYSFTVAAFSVALGPASEPIEVNTEPDVAISNFTEPDVECHDKHSQYKSEIKVLPIAVMGALTGIFAVIVIVLATTCACGLACFYQDIKRKIR